VSQNLKRDKMSKVLSNIFLACLCSVFVFFVTLSYYDFRVLFVAVSMDFHPAHALPLFIWFDCVGSGNNIGRWCIGRWSRDDHANHLP
jgi:hypothetical protein